MFVPPDVSHLPLTVLFSDRHLAVVVKPPELLSCPGTTTPGWDSVATRVPTLFPHATGSLLVHRLDAATSGLMVVALTTPTHVALSRQFARREVAKTYDAICRRRPDAGTPPFEVGMEGRITLPLRSDWKLRPQQVVDFENGKEAITDWRIVATDIHGPATFHVEFTPLTGRTHQLRVHASHPLGLGCPIVGDRIYGEDDDNGTCLHLHASRLGFRHPENGETMEFQSFPTHWAGFDMATGTVDKQA